MVISKTHSKFYILSYIDCLLCYGEVLQRYIFLHFSFSYSGMQTSVRLRRSLTGLNHPSVVLQLTVPLDILICVFVFSFLAHLAQSLKKLIKYLYFVPR